VNPNNCAVCEHKTNNPDGGFCYMFRDEPQDACTKFSPNTSWDWLPSMPSMPGPGLTLDVLNLGLNVAQTVSMHTARAATIATEGLSSAGSTVAEGLSAAAEGSAAALDAVVSAGGAVAEGLGSVAEGLGDALGSIDF
jgi:hypothetical protein